MYIINGQRISHLGEFCLTKIEVNAIIELLIVNDEKNHEQTLLKEKSKSNSKSDLRNKQMKELHVNLKNATDYLMDLFDYTGQRYSCTRVKMGKLLSIVAFVYAQKGEKLFDEDIYVYKGCGTSIEEMNAITDIAPYLKIEYQDDKQYINDDFAAEIEKNADNVELSEDVKQNIENVFRAFASFSAGDLGKCITPVISAEGLTDDAGKVILSQFSTLTKDAINIENSAIELVNFLFNQ